MQNARLSTGSIERLVDSAVLPAYEWTAPRWLDLHVPRGGMDLESRITADNPPRMLFVLASHCTLALPAESGPLHLGTLPADSRVLAPWAIDAATDLLFETQTPPEELLSLATDSLRGVFWGLHDWAHFHSHGPFERIAETELQCDVSALVWLWEARAELAIDLARYAAVVTDVVGIWEERFRAEGLAHDPEPALRYVQRRSGAPPSVLPLFGRA